MLFRAIYVSCSVCIPSFDVTENMMPPPRGCTRFPYVGTNHTTYNYNPGTNIHDEMCVMKCTNKITMYKTRSPLFSVGAVNQHHRSWASSETAKNWHRMWNLRQAAQKLHKRKPTVCSIQ